uniref:BTB domain-containing protein n=1 Tax=Meloidogyne enterolobii TaxID=390850 RepID=A0A6V7UZ39_MELEN|nr:unnamed protein product [Meloidogyne enterolobii]
MQRPSTLIPSSTSCNIPPTVQFLTAPIDNSAINVTSPSCLSGVENRIILNVGGIRYETYSHVLKKIPATRLSRLTPNLSNYDPVKNEYFFDRHPGAFSLILNYYRTGRETQETLALIESMEMDTDIRPTQEDVAKKFGWEDEYNNGKLNLWQQVKPKLWSLFEEPWTSRGARIISIISISCIVLSILCFCLKTNSGIRQVGNFPASEYVYFNNNSVLIKSMRRQNINLPRSPPTTPTNSFIIQFFYLELACNLWFTFEFIARLLFAPSRSRFIKNPLNLIDLFATTSFYIDWILTNNFLNNNDSLECLNIMRELILLFFFVVLGMILFASLIYYAERLEYNPENQFESITVGMWWALITISTIGYGDSVPKTRLGMVVGSLCALMGVLTIALPVPVIVANFQNIYSHSKARSKLPKRRLKVLQMSEIKAKERQQQNRFLSAWRNNNLDKFGSKTTAALLGTLTGDLSPAVAIAAGW